MREDMSVTEQVSPPENVASSSVSPLHRLKPPDLVISIAARYGLVIFLVFLIVLFSILEPKIFPTLTMAKTILVQQTVIMLLSLAVLPIVVVGEFDLSIGYVLGLCAVLIAALGGEVHLDGALTLLLTVIIAAAIGTLNGLLVAALRIPSMIATLGVGLAIGGLTTGVSGGRTLVLGIPHLVPDLSTTSLFGLSSAVWIVAVLCLLAYAVFAHTPPGRRMYAVGGSQVVARLAGIRTIRLKILAFAFGGVLVAIAGALELGQAGGADPSFGPNLLLPAYAAVFLGSTTIRPGFFNVWGTVVATLVLAVGFTGLTLDGVPYWTEPVFDGAALIIGVLLSRGEVRRAGR
jgi:ribose transport system permease protein